jgi:hypothetical protein
MNRMVCLAPAHTVAYLKRGGHFWVYQRSRGEFSCAKPAEGLFRFRTFEEAAAALEAAEADHERHARQARALAEEHFDAQRVVRRVLERAL